MIVTFFACPTFFAPKHTFACSVENNFWKVFLAGIEKEKMKRARRRRAHKRKNEENARRRRAKMEKWRAPKARGAFFRGNPLYFCQKTFVFCIVFDNSDTPGVGLEYQ